MLYSYAYSHDDGRISYPLCFISVSPQGCKPELQVGRRLDMFMSGCSAADDVMWFLLLYHVFAIIMGHDCFRT